MSNRRKPTGLRAALAAKQIRTVAYDIPVVDGDTADAASARVTTAQQVLSMVEYDDDADAKQRAQAVLDEAKADLAQCFHRVRFRGLTEADFDALVNEHPPTDAQKADDHVWNPDTFLYALAAACCVDDEALTAEEWRAELDSDRWSRADRQAFLNVVLDANRRPFSDGIPKG